MKTGKRMLAFTLVVLFILCAVPAVMAQTKVDINTATSEQLTQLRGIGPKTAERLIEYREANGLFNEPADIVDVPGIGPKIFEDNKDVISTGN